MAILVLDFYIPILVMYPRNRTNGTEQNTTDHGLEYQSGFDRSRADFDFRERTADSESVSGIVHFEGVRQFSVDKPPPPPWVLCFF
jgi:hypothetical protein